MNKPWYSYVLLAVIVLYTVTFPYQRSIWYWIRGRDHLGMPKEK